MNSDRDIDNDHDFHEKNDVNSDHDDLYARDGHLRYF